MTKESEYLVAYGFTKEGTGDEPTIRVGDKKYTIKGSPEEKLAIIRDTRKELTKSGKAGEFDEKLQGIADHDWMEVAKDQLMLTDYPTPISKYYISLESWHNSIEPYYHWAINFLGEIGFPVIDKITDIFTAAEHSSFYGAAGQRLGLAQDKVGQYLATIGKMIKDLFQLVRELRWIDERLALYYDVYGIDKKGNKRKVTDEQRKSAELALKGLWVDMVDGVVQGQRTGSNLFTMAQQLQFTTLPDLFFSITPKPGQDPGDAVEEQAANFNDIVKNALKRKLKQYYSWRDTTFDEIKNRRMFTIKYLNQHYQVINMYMQWVKPYIKHIERLSGSTDLLENPRMIAAFESSLIEIEILARMKPPGAKKQNVCIMLTFEYSTKPSMQYPGDGGYHRGPVHVGATRITWRSYAWSDDQIKAYKQMREKRDLALLTSIDKSLESAMDALGNDLLNYLKEAEEGKPEPEEERPEKQPLDIFDPFKAIGKGMKETFGVSDALKGIFPKGKKKPAGESPDKTTARKICWVHYSIFKKAHGLLAW